MDIIFELALVTIDLGIGKSPGGGGGGSGYQNFYVYTNPWFSMSGTSTALPFLGFPELVL